MTWIQTYTGKKFDFEALSPSAVDIRDIAHALANTCRFNGHCEVFYSVAEHSVHVANLLPRCTALCGLMHDAAEAYVGDTVRPMKQLIPQIKTLERMVWSVISTAFNLPGTLPWEVKHADSVMLATEARDLMKIPPNRWEPLPDPRPQRIIKTMTSEAAEAEFLAAYELFAPLANPLGGEA